MTKRGGLSLSFAAILLAGCGPSPSSNGERAPAAAAQRPVVIDLLNFPAAAPAFDPGKPAPNPKVVVGSFGRQLEVAWINPGARVSYPGVAVEAGDLFTAEVTIHEEAIGASDGCAFVVQFHGEDGSIREVFRKAVDRALVEHVGGWAPIEADLSPFAGQTDALVLTMDAGPSGNDIGDWGLWAAPAIRR